MKMRLNSKIANWIVDHHDNLILMGLITFSFPKLFLKSFYENNRGKKPVWNENKKACLTISFDCDFQEDIEAFPQLLDILSQYPFKASFACVGNWIEKYPKEHAKLLDAGHEIINHTYSHPDNEVLNPGRKFKEISRAEKREEIERCHEICRDLLGYEPIGCRIPHFKNLFTDEIYGVLKELGYVYSSSTWTMNTKSFGFPFKTKEGILEFPLSTCPKHPFTVFDTWHSFNTKRLSHRIVHRTEDEYYKLFKTLIDVGIETGSYVNIYIDPLDVPRKMKKFASILDYIANKEGDLWIARYEDIIKSNEYCP